MKRAALLMLCIALVACQAGSDEDRGEGTRQAGPQDASATAAWLSVVDDGALFIRWTETAGSLSGSIATSVSYQGSVSGDQEQLTGSRVGDDVTLNLGGVDVTGVIEGDRLTLYIPSESGRLEPLEFTASGIDEYNAAIDALTEDATEFAAAEGAIEQAVLGAEATRQHLRDVVTEGRAVAADYTNLVNFIASDIEYAGFDLDYFDGEIDWYVEEGNTYPDSQETSARLQESLAEIGDDLADIRSLDLRDLDDLAEKASLVAEDIRRAADEVDAIPPGLADPEDGELVSGARLLALDLLGVADGVGFERIRFETELDGLETRIAAMSSKLGQP